MRRPSANGSRPVEINNLPNDLRDADRSHAPRGNPAQDAPRQRRRGASGEAFPRGAWERSSDLTRAADQSAKRQVVLPLLSSSTTPMAVS
uniref:DUF1534 domain-containing protein n=1 Tax=Pseudomonas graminis TaxID=158627 RepID=A0A7C1WP40_9PSED